MTRAWLFVACALAVGACDKSSDAGGRKPRAGSGSSVDDTQREQDRFDAERKPEEVVKALKIGPGSRVADVGAGSGLLTVHLARAVKPNGKVVATDIDGGVLEMLSQRLDSQGLTDVVERRVVAPNSPGFEKEDGQYDAILLAEVDHLFDDEVGWLKEAQRALKPGGRIVISNRTYHHDESMAAAAKAGLVLEQESTPVPTHFIASYFAAKASK